MTPVVIDAKDQSAVMRLKIDLARAAAEHDRCALEYDESNPLHRIRLLEADVAALFLLTAKLIDALESA